METSAKNAKRKADLFDDDEEDIKLAKRAKHFETKGPINAIQAEDLKSLSCPPSPASIPSFEGRKPAEIFRTDLISAMKLPDTHILNIGSYINISDPWRQEWERGVQVPVNADGIQQPACRFLETQHKKPTSFKLPNKLLTSKKRSKQGSKCTYDLNRIDADWLVNLNRSRYNKGLVELEEGMLEKSIAYLENQCYDKMGHAIATQAGLSIEYDESVCCDICQSPDSEELNEMVFCDNCDICVHQACYGIQNIPVGSWLCQPCRKGFTSPSCLLCPQNGGALKKTMNGKSWAHVSCALWIPELGFGSVEKMEPVTRIENIPQSRWNLVCSICREKVGACIQCSVKSCVTAFHVMCGFKHGLEMKTLLDDSAADGVRHISYCMRHGYKNRSPDKRKDKEQEDAENLRQKRLKMMEEEFYKYVDVGEAAKELVLPKELMKRIHAFWTLKRKAQEDVPLLPPNLQQQQKLSGKQVAADVSRNLEVQLQRLVKLRCNLEGLRNLCYMVGKREKMSRDLYRVREQVFWKQHEMLTDDSLELSEEDMEWVLDMGRGHFTGAGGGEGSNPLGLIPSSSTASSSSGNNAGDRSSTEQNSNGGSGKGSGNGGASDKTHDSGNDANDSDAAGTSSGSDSEKNESIKPGRKGKRTGNSRSSKSNLESPRKGFPSLETGSFDDHQEGSSVNSEAPASQLQLDSELTASNSDVSTRRLVGRKRRTQSKGDLSPQPDRLNRSTVDAMSNEPATCDSETSGETAGLKAFDEGGRTLRSHQHLDTVIANTENHRQSPKQTSAHLLDLPCPEQNVKTPRNESGRFTTRQAKIDAPGKCEESNITREGSGRDLFAMETQKENEPVSPTTRSTRKLPEEVRSERGVQDISNDAADRDTTEGELQEKRRKVPSRTKRHRGKSRIKECVANSKQVYIPDLLRRKTPLRASRSCRSDDRTSPAEARLSCAKTYANGRELHEHGACPNCKVGHDKNAVFPPDSPDDGEDSDMDEQTPSRRLRVRSVRSSNSRARCSPKEDFHESKSNCCGSLMAKFLLK